MDIEAHMMSTLERVKWFRIRTAIVFYAAVAIATFGYAADAKADSNASSACYSVRTTTDAAGNTASQIDPKLPLVQCTDRPAPGVAGMFAGALWPLYWSWEIWD